MGPRRGRRDQQPACVNTLGVAIYRNAKYNESIPLLERSLTLNPQESGAYDLLFLALCSHQQGDAAAAREHFAEATSWFDANRARPPNSQEELTRLLNEAHAIVRP